MNRILSALLVLSLATGCDDLASYVNVFTGTAGTGHTHPCASRPFGLIQAGPDTGNGSWHYCSGYAWNDDAIIGFTQDHLNGTGCPDLGDIRLMPFSDAAERERAPFDKADEKAWPGFYSVKFKSGILTEVSASRHTAIYRFTFGKGPKRLMVDTQYGIWSWGKANTHLKSDDSSLDGKRGISGRQRRHRWTGRDLGYAVVFDRDCVSSVKLPRAEDEKASRYVFDFDIPDGGTLSVKVALSSTSPEAAKRNLAAEIPDWDLPRVAADAREEWNRLFSRATIEGSDEQKRNWYTSLYHLYQQPNDIADVGDTPFYSTLSLWDTFRAAHPLYTVITPEVISDFVNSMYKHYRQVGRMPIWALWGNETNCMIGNHSISVIVDWFFKTLGTPEHNRVDWRALFAAMKDSITTVHPGVKREDWPAFDQYGYYPFDLVRSQSVSRALECSYDAHCLVRMAKALGLADDAAFFSKRADCWKLLFDRETGFMRGRDTAGNWRTPFDPYAFGHGDQLPNDYTEGNAFQYTWHVLQDPMGLIDLMGGKDVAVRKLNDLFQTEASLGGRFHSSDISGLIGQYVHGNEPSHHVIYFYTLAGRPDRAAECIREVFDRFYFPRPDGLCGNDDCGQMSAWYIFSAMGFYPFSPASGEYVIGAPQVPSATILLPNGKTFRMLANNLSERNKYVKSVSFNGRPILDWKFSHADLMAGGELVFEMFDSPMPPAVAPFADGERVAFFGDSITHGGKYVAYLQLFQNLRHPGCGTRIMNAGVSGDSTTNAILRLDWDLASMRPDRVFTMFGMNDVRRGLWNDASPSVEIAEKRRRALKDYAKNQRHIAEGLAKRGIPEVLVTPTPYDQYTRTNKMEYAFCNDPGLASCASIVRELAAEKGLSLVDFHQSLTSLQKLNPDYAFCTDRVHPDTVGHIIMAATLLESMEVSPIVCKTTIDVADAEAIEKGIAFDYAPTALPLPKTPEYEQAERFYPLTSRLNRELLVVKGLEETKADSSAERGFVFVKYDVCMDGRKIGTYTATQLASGVNVALEDTPNQRISLEAAKIADELIRFFRSQRRYVLMRSYLRNGGVKNLEDIAACDAWVDGWLAREKDSIYIKTYHEWADAYRQFRGKFAAEMAREESLREQLNAVRPVTSRVTITRAE